MPHFISISIGDPVNVPGIIVSFMDTSVKKKVIPALIKLIFQQKTELKVNE